MSKEMTAVEYLKEKRRMCRTIKWCDNCPMNSVVNNENMCAWIELKNPEEAVAIVQKWAEEHPVRTRQSEFLKMFPNVRKTKDGIINICPCHIDSREDFKYDHCNWFRNNCEECEKFFWLEELPEAEVEE